MKLLELFSGSGILSDTFRNDGHYAFTVDYNKYFFPDLVMDINEMSMDDVNFKPSVVWASPPCQCFSVASIPKYWFIENPRGMLRTQEFMRVLPGQRYTISYCSYGENRQKPTDIWTNHPDPQFKPLCKRGDLCHIRTPRGSHEHGTQGLKNRIERGRLPLKLCEHILKICPSNRDISNQEQ